MDTLTIYFLIIAGILLIDSCMCVAIGRSKDALKFKPAGIVALILLCLISGQRKYPRKNLGLQRFFLSLLVVLFLLLANYLFLKIGPPKNADILQFGLALVPLITLPFFHFLYEFVGAHPLSIERILFNFHLRGIIALIISANVIFIAIQSMHTIFSLIGHFALTFIALLGSFYLCSLLRKPTSTYEAPFRDEIDYLEPAILKYLASILEYLYYLILIYFLFIKDMWKILLVIEADLWILCVSLALLLLATTTIVKLRFYQHEPFTLEFYEEKALPLSFLLFGLTSILRFYF